MFSLVNGVETCLLFMVKQVNDETKTIMTGQILSKSPCQETQFQASQPAKYLVRSENQKIQILSQTIPTNKIPESMCLIKHDNQQHARSFRNRSAHYQTEEKHVCDGQCSVQVGPPSVIKTIHLVGLDFHISHQ